MLDLVTDLDKDQPLTTEILEDPAHPVTLLMLTIYSLETFVYKSLNWASRLGDLNKVESLGPYAQVMDKIVEFAIKGRRDELDDSKFCKLDLFRGTCLTDTQIKQYEDHVDSGEAMSIFGYISCTTSEDKARSFASDDLSDINKPKYATVYHIKWTKGLFRCWYFDDSAYPDEKEVLLRDGMRFTVLSVDKESKPDGSLIIIK